MKSGKQNITNEVGTSSPRAFSYSYKEKYNISSCRVKVKR